MQISTVIIGLIILTSCQPERTALPFFNDKDFSPIWSTPKKSDFHSIKHFKLQDQNGSVFNSDELDDKIVIANFFFTRCPGICPKLTMNLSVVQDYLNENKKAKLLSFSVTPEADSSSVLLRYAERFDVKYPQWKLLTGDKEIIYNLAYHSFFAQEMSDVETDFIHSEMVWLLDQNQRIRGIYNGTIPLEVSRLIEDAQTLLSIQRSE